MREILFRGKRKDNGEWIEGSLVSYPELEMTIIEHNEQFFTSHSALPVFKVIPETVGQYTGLTDKNGTRIFEGDIVKMNSGKRYIGIVEYWEDSFRVASHIIRYYDFVSAVADGFGAVIGNVFDNPELLEGKTK